MFFFAEIEVLDKYVRATYPDLRKTINTVQLNVQDGVLHDASEEEASSEWRLQMVELFKQGKINEARKLVCAQARPEECEEIYRWLYDNLDIISKDNFFNSKQIF